LVNREAHNGGWLFKIKMTDPAELDELLDFDAYKAMLGK
jgi:glycine cleavage system H protein